MASSNQNFSSSGSNTIDLSSGDITTDLLLVGNYLGFSIECINATGLNGSPSWNLKASNENDVNELKTWSTSALNVGVDDAIIYRNYPSVNYFAIEFLVNDNTTGSIEIIIRPNG